MRTKKTITEELESLGSFRDLVQTYEEIAATHMRKVRSTVLGNRDFLEGIKLIFQKVRSSYKEEVAQILLKRNKNHPEAQHFFRHNGKKVYVLISANAGLYGSIIQETFNLFIAEVKKKPTDVTIIGKLGLQAFKDMNLKIPYTYFDFPDSTIDPIQLKDIAKHLTNYEEVIAFYPQFTNIILQNPTRGSITGELLEEGKTVAPEKFIFEPSLERVLAFFETQIITALFEQTLSESQLAKFASRMINLDKASDNIKVLIGKGTFESQKISHYTENRKQRSLLSSMSLWRR